MLRALSERGELNAPHGRFIVGTLIFQDLCVVPMVLIIPRLGSNQDPSMVWTEIGVALSGAAAVMVGALVISKLIVPRLLNWVDASRSRDVFLLSVLTICIGTAWLTSLAGMSLALGAFLPAWSLLTPTTSIGRWVKLSPSGCLHEYLLCITWHDV